MSQQADRNQLWQVIEHVRAPAIACSVLAVL
jgi:hypothetical protein